MSYWNHRVMRRVFTLPNGEIEYQLGIYEIYYDDNGNVNGWTQEPVAVVGDDLEWTLNKMQECLGKPILEYEE